tara:strand:+ start:436 stop:876 length:441 start_codon:yes stop_codon:yes gene_type:complete
MPTAEQSWLKRFPTYYAATEQNKKLFSKRIKQLMVMLEDESFLKYLSNPENKDDILMFLLNSHLFDDYIILSEQGEPYIQDTDFGLIHFMKKMVGSFQSEHYMLGSIVRKQSKIYIKLYIQHLERRHNDEITKMRDAFKTGTSLPF